MWRLLVQAFLNVGENPLVNRAVFPYSSPLTLRWSLLLVIDVSHGKASPFLPSILIAFVVWLVWLFIGSASLDQPVVLVVFWPYHNHVIMACKHDPERQSPPFFSSAPTFVTLIFSSFPDYCFSCLYRSEIPASSTLLSVFQPY